MARNRAAARRERKQRKFHVAVQAHLEAVEEIVASVATLSAADDPLLEGEPTLEERLFIAAWSGFWLGRTGSTAGAAGDCSDLDALRKEKQNA